MRISDWSSDVCSSDLTPPPGRARSCQDRRGRNWTRPTIHSPSRFSAERRRPKAQHRPTAPVPPPRHRRTTAASPPPARLQRARKRVEEGKRGSVRVEPGGRSIIKKKKKKH